MQDSESKEVQAAEYLKARFGVEIDKTENYSLKERSGDVWVVSKQVKNMGDEISVETHGLRAIRFMKIGLKPTTYLLQLLGNELQKNVVELEEDELKQLLAREKMIPADIDEQGYVALKHKDRVIGCGFYKDDVVSSRVPKGRSREFLEFL